MEETIYLEWIDAQEQLSEQTQDIQSVLNMLEGNTDRQKIINFIKEYLLKN